MPSQPFNDRKGLLDFDSFHGEARFVNVLFGANVILFFLYFGGGPDDSRILIPLLIQKCQVAWYPDDPSDDEKMKMKNFFDALARFYPCTYCADDFSKNLRKSPVP